LVGETPLHVALLKSHKRNFNEFVGPQTTADLVPEVGQLQPVLVPSERMEKEVVVAYLVYCRKD
jgi:hypothetical protein